LSNIIFKFNSKLTHFRSHVCITNFRCQCKLNGAL